MKNFLHCAIFLIASVLLSALPANAHVTNHQAQADSQLQTPNSFWVENTFFEWTGEELIVTQISESGLAQAALQKDGTFKINSPRNALIYVYNPETDWKNKNEYIIIGEREPESYNMYGNKHTIFENRFISQKNRLLPDGRTITYYLTYTVIITKGKIKLEIHTLTYEQGVQMTCEIIHKRTFTI